MSGYQRTSMAGGAAPAQNLSLLARLQTASLDGTTLPAEIMVSVLDYLPVPDLMRVARTSRRLREMVYDDTRWVARLKSMGCWNETEARKRFEDAMRRKRDAYERAGGGTKMNEPGSRQTIFDATAEEERQKSYAVSPSKAPDSKPDGFETLSLSNPASSSPFQDPAALLNVLKNVRSIRGFARQEYGKVYGALAPFYLDLAESRNHTNPIVFQVFRDPEAQAQMLSNLQTFRNSDWTDGWQQRAEKLTAMAKIFEGAVLREFEQGYEFWDVDGKMHRYAHVLDMLNGGTAAMDLFVQKHPILMQRDGLGNSIDCINQAPRDDITLEPSRLFFSGLADRVNGQSDIISRVFPHASTVFWLLVDKIREEIVMDYMTPLLDETHDRDMTCYLKACSGLFEQCMQFARSLQPPPGSESSLEHHAKEISLKSFEPHLDLYMQEEIDNFVQYAERQVGNWEQRLSEQDATVESFYMGNFNRRADKNDFLSSFKKVVMMPVTALPGRASTKPSSRASVLGTPGASRPQTPGIAAGGLDRSGSPFPTEAPTDELKAKAALMANRLEGIKSLFSIEVALDIVHAAKTSLGRAEKFIGLGGQAGGEAREQCLSIFVALLRILGQTHIKNGFAKAVDHLSRYNPREISDHSQAEVAPLTAFIELVNVGDLISQMVDVFFEQQLTATKIADRNDFLDPAALAKKKFEQMLDENVAAGLNKGIDVLMDEVEYICATTQLPTDYNPHPLPPDMMARVDPGIGPTTTAKRVVELVSSHTKMLVGTTEKAMLDVFNGEVGLRLFTALCKHLKRQRISIEGAIKLIADVNLYFDYVRTLKNPDLLVYFKALRELSQIFLIDPSHAKEMAAIIANADRFEGIFRPEDAYEFAERRADWYQVKKAVEKAMYGLECLIM